jgi:pimeloyl-ACP methyl ester carboxylesterase
MANFVLVHGAWHGGWCWRDVRRVLEDNGHTVFTPTLTGLGERSHLLSSDIDLETHIADVVNLLVWEELNDVILVGHSYGGMVITGVADRAKDRLRHIVYLDAFLPADGESSATHMVKLMNPDATDADFAAEVARRRAAGNALGGGAPDLDRLFDIPADMAEKRAWVKRRVTPHPVGTQVTPIRLENGGPDGLPRTYILCAGAPGRTPFMVLADRLRHDDGWTYRELDTTHDSMVTMPSETAALFMEAIGD